MARGTQKRKKRDDFVTTNEKAKSHIVAQIVRLARKERLDYTAFNYVCQQARKKLGLRRPRQERKLPQLLPETELRKFFRVIQECGDLQHEIMLKLLFYTAVRVSELVRIKVSDIDFAQCKIFIEEGKGRGDRYILFPASFRLVLQSHLRANPKTRYLFETTRCTPFTTRRVQQISGHESKRSLEVYQHLSLKNVEQAYQEAVKGLEV